MGIDSLGSYRNRTNFLENARKIVTAIVFCMSIPPYITWVQYRFTRISLYPPLPPPPPPPLKYFHHQGRSPALLSHLRTRN